MKNKNFFHFSYSIYHITNDTRKPKEKGVKKGGKITMSTMINPKYEGDKVAYLDNEFIRKSTALQPLNELEINLLIYMCYKAKENVDVETHGGWCDLIEIDMKKFLDGIGYSKSWTDYTDDEKMAVYQRLKEMQEKTFEIRTERHKELDRKCIFRLNGTASP